MEVPSTVQPAVFVLVSSLHTRAPCVMIADRSRRLSATHITDQ